MELKQHWDKVFTRNPLEKLGWYETDLSPTFNLIDKTGLDNEARILNVGAGSTTLVDALLDQGYTNIIATDISDVALANLQTRIGEGKIEVIVDDLISPTKLNEIPQIDLWIDRAVLHFFTIESDQETYFLLLKRLLNEGGYALLAQFNLDGADKCSGLPVHRYSEDMLQERLGDEFNLIESFEYTYTMPSGDQRPYIYTLFHRH